ncbi:hypothetical protein AJ79_08795 [Helicocarpus griseus UAMH5409]|uniref:Zn(2)-C6 fungal-type domain-containing protein n=1 Tax=Helicocarpus griseus UAMH5409 TaxID=1447875 RepID=A0A2B7WQ64_9EURO|nr:hypothetical protein AJ79_08795 [Helicocarpus griseus UAMH5409]
MNSEARQTPDASGGTRRRRQDDEGHETVHVQKRQRVSRACDTCRNKKDRCDGARPVCSTCATLGRSCTYKPKTKKRGLPTGYLRTLELLWGLVFSKIRGSERVVTKLLKSTALPYQADDIIKEEEGPDAFMSAWKRSSVLKEIEASLSVSEPPEDDTRNADRPNADSVSPHGAGENDHSFLDVLEWSIPDGLEHAGENIGHGTDPSRQAQTRKTSTNPLPKRQTRDCGTQCIASDSDSIGLRLPKCARELFDIYFTYTHCWFPILEKHDILRTAFGYSEHSGRISPYGPGSGDHAAMWAIFALASLQQSSRKSNPEVTLPRGAALDTESLYATARNMIPAESGPYEIGHVQALLLLGLVKIGQRNWSTAGIIVGLAIRISLTLGLGGSSATLGPTNKKTGRSRHVFLGCFVLETLISAQLGCPPALRKEDTLKVGLLQEDGLDEWHPWEDQARWLPQSPSNDFFVRGPLFAMSTFNHLVKLVYLLNDFGCCICTGLLSLPKLEDFERRLEDWSATLPEHYRVRLDGDQSAQASPHVLGLHILYDSIVLIIQLRSQSILCNQSAGRDYARQRTLNSLNRLEQFLQAYIDSYSISAMSPTFIILLNIVVHDLGGGGAGTPLYNLDSNLMTKVRRILSQIYLVWQSGDCAAHQTGLANQVPTSISHFNPAVAINSGYLAVHTSPPPSMPHPSTAQGSNRRGPVHDAGQENARASMERDGASGHPKTRNLVPLIPWETSKSRLDAGIQFPLPVSTSSFITAENSADALGQLPGQASYSTTSSSKLPSPFQPSNPYYTHISNDTNVNPESLSNIDGYQPSARIPPDLDALFDELASLEGSEKTETQPTFMQNLGFGPTSGVSDLHSYSTSFEMLGPSQQTGVTSHYRPEDNRDPIGQAAFEIEDAVK